MYWNKKGKTNTDATLAAALKRGRELNLKHLVLASSTGATAEKVLDSGFKVVCVTRHAGFSDPGEMGMDPAMRRKLQEKGVTVLTTTHLLAGVDRALRFKFQGLFPAEIIAASLRLLGEGLKVCVEISVMALDAGLIPYGEEIIAVAGTGGGADTACIILPAHSNYFFDTIVKEIICKPRG